MAKAIFGGKRSTSKAAQARDEAALRGERIRRAAHLLKQVSDPTRIQVLTLLSGRERHVGELCEEMAHGRPAVSHHLALLRHGGIVDRRRRGKNNFYSLTDTGERLSGIIKGVVR